MEQQQPEKDPEETPPPIPPAEPDEEIDEDEEDEEIPGLEDIMEKAKPEGQKTAVAGIGKAPPAGSAEQPTPPEESKPPEPEKPPKLELGKNNQGEPIEIPVELLKRHFVILGASGSGKTVLGKAVLEEAALNGIPSIIIDPQGDLASLAILGDAAEVESKGTDPMKIVNFGSRVEVRIFTPASSKGIPISANPLQLPPADLPEEEKIRSLDLVSTSLALLLGYDTEVEEGKAVKSLLFMVFEDAFRKGKPFRDFDSLAGHITDLPDDILQKAATVASEKDRAKLSRNLRFMSVGMNQLLFTFGIPVKMEYFMKPVTEGKVPVNVIYLNTLTSDEHKQFFVTMVAREIYNWMLRNPSDKPQLVFSIDEVGPYLPPNPYMPPAKDILRLLFKQGRKYGVSCLMCTQNVADVDYKAMAQAATWSLGRMMTMQDQNKVKPILQAMNTANLESIVSQLPQLKTGQFILISPDVYPSAVQMKVRWLVTKHMTLEEERLREVMSPNMLAYFEAIRTGKPLAPPVKPAAPAPGPGATGPTVPGTAGQGAPTTGPATAGASQPAGPEPTAPSEPISHGPYEYIEMPPAGTEPTEPAEDFTPVGGTQKAASHGQSRGMPPIGIPDKPKISPALAAYTGPMLICRLEYPQAKATNIASKLVVAKMFEKVAVDKGELKYLPLWQLKLTVNPFNYMNSFVKMFSKGKDKPQEETIYLNAMNGKLMVVKDKCTFANVATEDPSKIKDLDGTAFFEERAMDYTMPDLVPPLVESKSAIGLAFKMFGVTPSEVKLVLLPVWTFTMRIEGKWVAHVKYVDGVFGMEIPDNPYSAL